MGQHNRAADLLVSMTGVNTQTDVRLDGLVELGLAGGDHQLGGLVRIVLIQMVDQLHAVLVLLTMLHFNFLPCGISGTTSSHIDQGRLDPGKINGFRVGITPPR